MGHTSIYGFLTVLPQIIGKETWPQPLERVILAPFGPDSHQADPGQAQIVHCLLPQFPGWGIHGGGGGGWIQ